jgi:hypothetical protein
LDLFFNSTSKVSSSEVFNTRFKDFLEENTWEFEEINGNKYYVFYTSGETNLKKYIVYYTEDYFVSFSLYSKESEVNLFGLKLAVQSYLSLCGSSVQTSCDPNWLKSTEPIICPSSGVQKEIWTDVNNCEENIEKTINCTIGNCGGCSANGKCYPIGYRVESSYCDFEGLVEQKIESSQCSNNFECSSNICINGSCVDPSMWEKFLSWFRALFGVNFTKSLGGFYE